MLLPPCSRSGWFWPFSFRSETPAAEAALVFCISKVAVTRLKELIEQKISMPSESTRDFRCNTCLCLDRRGPPFWWRTVRNRTPSSNRSNHSLVMWMAKLHTPTLFNSTQRLEPQSVTYLVSIVHTRVVLVILVQVSLCRVCWNCSSLCRVIKCQWGLEIWNRLPNL